MIGRWLSLLSPEQEDRVLTGKMWPGQYTSPCLVGVVGYDVDTVRMVKRLGAAVVGTCLARHSGSDGLVEIRYDRLCLRFSVPRINTAVRSRILRNRLRRELAGVRAEVVVGA